MRISVVIGAKAFIPQHVPNSVVLWVWNAMRYLVRFSKKSSKKNRDANESVLLKNTTSGRACFVPNTYIENQSQWDRVHFGNYKISYSGCEIIAVYNALLSLDKKLAAREMVDLICLFERNGSVLSGKWGISPKAAYAFFKKLGYRVIASDDVVEESINILGEQSDTIIVTAYNDCYDILKGLHTVNISKDGDGRYLIHNGYRAKIDSKGNKKYISSYPYQTLWEAIKNMSNGKASPIYVIGISSL